jgi:hypothetical protein
MAMMKHEMQRLLALVGRLARGQRQELVDRLKTQSNAEASVEVASSAGDSHPKDHADAGRSRERPPDKAARTFWTSRCSATAA